MAWQDWLDFLLPKNYSAKATELDQKVQNLEAEADAAETAANLRKRAIEAKRRIAAARKVAPGRGLTSWILIGGLLVLIVVFARSCF